MFKTVFLRAPRHPLALLFASWAPALMGLVFSTATVGCLGSGDGDSMQRQESDDRGADDRGADDRGADDEESDDRGADDEESDDETPAVNSPADPNAGEPGAPSASDDTGIDVLAQRGTSSLDLLLVIDNSLGMAHKQRLFAQVLPEWIQLLTEPSCVSGEATVPAQNGECPSGFVRAPELVTDLHVGVITSSLGGFGAVRPCADDEGEAEQEVDNAHLLGSLPRAGGETPGFLRWCAGSDSGSCEGIPAGATSDGFSARLQQQITSAGEYGCGWEATLEAWYRFLIDPYPWTKIVRQSCFSGDSAESCVGPEMGADASPLIDSALLAQRAQFLRPDSVVSIVMFSDENDCSFKASGQSWRLSQISDEAGAYNSAYKGSAACASDPNDQCCQSCGVAQAAPGCPTTTDEAGQTVPAGCEQRLYPDPTAGEPSGDAPSLRCFNQKQRFGIDYLYPVERYSNALSLPALCPFTSDLEPEGTDCDASSVVPNPLYAANDGVSPRSQGRVFLAGIVGVPWQDLAVDPEADSLSFRPARAGAEQPGIDWSLILGEGNTPPADPLMQESPSPRSGVHPITGEPIGPADESGAPINSINGNELALVAQDELQYACIFPLPEPEECPAPEDVPDGRRPFCDCTDRGAADYQNPLCPVGGGLTQSHARAYPATRQLQVLRDFGPNSVVTSICPRQTSDSSARDYGYRPAVMAITDALSAELSARCLPRILPVEDGQVPCQLVEALGGGAACGAGRQEVDGDLAERVRDRAHSLGLCPDRADCDALVLCEIPQLEPGTDAYDSCLADPTPVGDGWCYVDPEQGLGAEEQLVRCPATAQRKIRFTGTGNPEPHSTVFFACDP